MKNRIVLLGDSLGMPTGKDEVIYEDTYPYILSKKLINFEIISRHRRTNDTLKQLATQNLFDDIEMLNPNYLVIHLGIVDCAPRVFSRLQQVLIRFLPNVIQKVILKFISNYRYNITKIFQKVYVTPEQYKINIAKFIEISKQNNIKLIFIAILQTNAINNKKSFNFKQNIDTYNEILEQLCLDNKITLIKYEYPNNFLLHDGIHINQNGNNFLAEQISSVVSGQIK